MAGSKPLSPSTLPRRDLNDRKAAKTIGASSGAWGLAILPLLFLVLLIVLVVVFTRRSLPDGTALLTPRRLVEGYVYTVVLVTMLLVSSGLGDVVKAGIARRYGVESSYRPQPVYDENHKVGETPKFEYDAKGMRRDVLSGSASLAVGLLVGMLHLLGLRRLARTEAAIASPVYRLFLIFGLVIYTVAVQSPLPFALIDASQADA